VHDGFISPLPEVVKECYQEACLKILKLNISELIQIPQNYPHAKELNLLIDALQRTKELNHLANIDLTKGR
jgi:hypothetical protein